MTAAKNASHTFHGIPERSAMMSIRFIVPRSLSRVWSKVSFIFSASADESRISSPIAVVICFIASPYVSLVPMKASAICLVKTKPRTKGGIAIDTHIFESAHFAHDALHLRIILALELVEHRIAILPLAIRRR